MQEAPAGEGEPDVGNVEYPCLPADVGGGEEELLLTQWEEDALVFIPFGFIEFAVDWEEILFVLDCPDEELD